ncbi:adenylyltransferase/cytidyltransferase family protein [Planococcus sp. 4-30]|uniref:adenylyltransferase/cytidyltransferase family protein n=1 Tax=Planococcus sp. 4-30 TaxID=2874583 RepID=UPI001CBA7C06|nr:adenylyltransferase/cytidyltransferase family protein [Planococcus sp. 4-30]
MKTIEIDYTNLQQHQLELSPHVIALGFFDGLHKGHRTVIEEAKKKADLLGLPLSVMSFFPHPKSVLSKGKVQVDYLMPLEKKQQRLAELGVDLFLIVEFNLDFAALSPEQFVQDYLVGLSAQHVVCGFDYTYGSKGAGNVTTLANHGGGQFGVTEVAKVEVCGDKISSTRIREKLATGDIEFLQNMMGEAYTIEWCPENGLLPHYTLPAAGEYVVTLKCHDREMTGILQVTADRQINFNRIGFISDRRMTIKWHKEVEENVFSFA